MTPDADTVLRVRPLSLVDQADDVLVGNPDSGRFVVIPQVGGEVLRLLIEGASVGRATEHMAGQGIDVDVAAFATSIVALGFAEIDDGTRPHQRALGTGPTPPRWARPFTGAPIQVLSAVAAVATIVLLATHPDLVPRSNDMFFLDTPVRSVIAGTLISDLLRMLHEVCHYSAVRALGLPSRISINRRLYFLVFVTDLTGLWSLPARRRYWPMLIGMAFDTGVLLLALLGRFAAQVGWWHPEPFVLGLLAAIAFIQVMGIVPQLFVFLRTDVYAVMMTALGTFDLWQVTRATVRHALGRARPEHLARLDRAHPRDRQVARWFAWVYAGGIALACWYFLTVAGPVLLHVVGWAFGQFAAADVTTVTFWEAAAFMIAILGPYAVTGWVALRERRPRGA